LSITCSCGCRVEDLDETFNIICQSEALGENGYQKALSYQTVCGSCKEDYRQEGLLFKDETEAFNWLNKKEN
jgi:hypothetical protein